MEVVEDSAIAIVRARLARCRSDLKDLDLVVEAPELIMRTPEEYLMIKAFREMKLEETKAAVKSRMTNRTS